MKNKLYRSRSDRMITGICGGVARYFNIDPTLIRLVAALGAIFSFGTFAFIYIVASLVIPKEPEYGFDTYDSFSNYK
ncbi:phage shock protein PspC (stress-responsive transcriptional regulator) [Paenibacillus shirakamiensis]|uniref:Phage shock protein PspC (Stress-responsive transcriptional regulator) n=1 Tax=Paenibacillus shirakamiensis TaxID=1265935 RepID=A0ABS4JLX9_9BACL|nr:PspC domain-containing protein [Paenibacillus shirakamiensis]MBP2001584.1 phage shock protein PspC (stress-responsive transcriptional regulator) [Paenibacillus shirakamiensis]